MAGDRVYGFSAETADALLELVAPTAPSRNRRSYTPPPSIDVFWVTVDSLTPTSGRYPGSRHTYDAGDDDFTDVEDIWIVTANGETPELGTYYLGSRQGVANGREVWQIDASGVTSIVSADGTITVTSSSGAYDLAARVADLTHSGIVSVGGQDFQGPKGFKPNASTFTYASVYVYGPTGSLTFSGAKSIGWYDQTSYRGMYFLSAVSDGINNTVGMCLDEIGDSLLLFGASGSSAYAVIRSSTIYRGVDTSIGGKTVKGGIVTGGTFSVGTSDLAADAVTNAILANAAAYSFKGNLTGSAANPTDIVLADIPPDVPASGDFVLGFLATGEQAKFDIADLPGGYADEQAQDAVGTILTDSSTIDFTYTDATPEITASVKANSVGVALMTASATDKLFGRSTAGAGAGEEIACTAAGRALLDDVDAAAQRTTLGLGTAATTSAGDYDAAGSAAAAQAASQPLDATLTALAGANWAANSLAIGSGSDTVAQVTFAVNTFPARASTGNLVAKPITDFALSILDDADAAAVRATIGAGVGGGDALTTNPLSQFASTTSAQLASVLSDETGTNKVVFSTAPTFDSTVTIGTAGGTTGAALFKGTTSGTVTVTVAAAAGTHTIKLPTADGTAGQVLVTDGSGQWSWASAGGSSTPNYAHPSGFRLGLQSGVAVSTSDQAAITTIYMNVFTGDYLLVPNTGATDFDALSPGNLSLALGTLTANKNYDVFCWNNGGTPTLALSSAWTSDTARNDALGTLKGVQVNNATIGSMGAKRGIYLGTFRTDTTTTTLDTAYSRFVWNCYNRVARPVYKVDSSTASWTYTSTTWRQANAATSYKIEVVAGLAFDPVRIQVDCVIGDSTPIGATVGVGVDSTATNSATVYPNAAGSFPSTTCEYNAIPSLGYHAFNWLERTGGGGTVTFYNYVSGARQAGMTGTVMA